MSIEIPDDAKLQTPDGREVILLHKVPAFRNDHLQHEIPLGQVVKLELETCFDIFGDPTYIKDPETGKTVRNEDPDRVEIPTKLKGVAHLIVVGYTRDCDGTPLYALSSKPIRYLYDLPATENYAQLYKYKSVVGFFTDCWGADSLTPLEGQVVPIKYQSIYDFLDSLRSQFSEYGSTDWIPR